MAMNVAAHVAVGGDHCGGSGGGGAGEGLGNGGGWYFVAVLLIAVTEGAHDVDNVVGAAPQRRFRRGKFLVPLLGFRKSAGRVQEECRKSEGRVQE